MSDALIARGRAETPKEGYEPGRLRRAAQRAVKRLGPQQFRVAGNHEAYWDVNLDLDTPCDCPDAQFHGRGCLHELAARLQNGDMGLIQGLGDMLLKSQKQNEALARQARKRSA